MESEARQWLPEESYEMADYKIHVLYIVHIHSHFFNINVCTCTSVYKYTYMYMYVSCKTNVSIVQGLWPLNEISPVNNCHKVAFSAQI